MNYYQIAEALATTARDEGLKVTTFNGNFTLQKDQRCLGLVVCGDYDITFYYKLKGQVGLSIESERDSDAAFSRGLDFIYSTV